MPRRKPAPGSGASERPGGGQIEWHTNPTRRKATFNLSDQVQRELEKLWMHLRVQEEIPTSKSEIVEIAIQLVIEDIEEQGDYSALMRRLSRQARRA